MTSFQRCLALGALTLLAPASAALDLRKVPRAIAKQPVYQSQTPTYCLLVFGPKAATRVWLARDGDLLYVDRNGNGDLTEPGKKISAKKDGTARHWSLGTICDQKTGTRYTDLEVHLSKDYSSIFVVGEGWGLKKVSAQAAFMTFARRPRSARIIHFFGPLALRLAITEGGARDLVVHIGTPGLGKRTFADATWNLQSEVKGALSGSVQYPGGRPEKVSLRWIG